MDDHWLIGIAKRLDRLRRVRTDVLNDVVTSNGACMTPEQGRLPEADDDREFAKLLCGGCPVQDECLELELRTAGVETIGVWGAMADVDRRALHSLWRQRGERGAQ
ncbi:WhiB family transcriptional regulator [Amycolatopsis sp. NPDC051758]|uniref:WhiB family transcriptional regulator n=1 Tax=Amycolatopsis sp. NPDC051758 TaxID=3363935 RepID=UPI00379F53FB